MVKLATEGGIKQYRGGGRKRMTFGKKKKADLKEGDRMFDALAEKVEKPRRRERVENSWIRQATWELVDRRTQLRREGKLDIEENPRLSRRIKKSLREDRRERARRAGEEVMGHLREGRVREAWGTIWGWHKTVEPKAAKPCFRTMEDQTRGREELYGFQQLPGERIPRNAERAPSDDGPPTDEELRRATLRSGNGKSGGASTMQAKDLKEWLRGAEKKEKAEAEGDEGFQGREDTWRLLVKLDVVQHIWETGEIPCQMLRIVVVLIPKGSLADYRGIGMLEVVWKLIKKVVDERLSKIELHDASHGFRAKHGCRTGIMEPSWCSSWRNASNVRLPMRALQKKQP